ncbi:hypothetical protein TI05_17060 [Achromatium sp. WMS3]|nr:hypothetical protein TI05_17060 [Achromatium sp. WMS3]
MSKYFKMREAVDEFRYSYGVKEKTGATLKILGKSVFNVGVFTVTEAVPKIFQIMVENARDKAK